MTTAWIKYCDDLLASQGLKGWKTTVSRGRRTIGYCDYTNKRIALSRYHLENDEKDYIEDTIIHEVAHALTPGNNHGKAWRKKSIELGGTGKQYAQHSNYPSKWETMCVNGHSPKMFRWDKESIYSCKCGSLVYIKHSDGTPLQLSTSYVERFNRRALDRNSPLIDHRGLPLL